MTSLLALVSARPQNEAEAEVLVQEYEQNGDGSYGFRYETSNGIKATQASQDGIAAQGEYSYTAPDGVLIELSYEADERGFLPNGKHLPIGPPTPAHVIELLEFIKAHPPQDDPNFNAAFLDAELTRLKG